MGVRLVNLAAGNTLVAIARNAEAADAAIDEQESDGPAE